MPTPLPQGALPAATAAAACALDAAVHAWDIAVALGQPGALPDGLAARLLPAARSIVEPLRQFGAYAAALPPSRQTTTRPNCCATSAGIPSGLGAAELSPRT